MLLDTFTILFESDAKQLDEGIDDSQKKAKQLVDELDKADVSAGKATSSIGAAFKALAPMVASFLAIGAARQGFVQTVEELNVIGRTADSLGLAVEDVDAFGRAMTEMGGDAQGARDSLVDMAESIGEAVQDVESGRAKVYQTLGISLKGVNGQAITATEGLLRLSDAVSGLSREEAIFRIKELGITDNRTVELLLKGRQEVERMLAAQKEQSGVTKEAVENARKYQEAVAKLNNAQDSITTQMAVAFIPAITTVIDWLTKGVVWARENKNFMVGFFGTIAAVVATIYLPAMIAAAAATIAATWPMILAASVVAGLAAAFALAYDDIMNFLDGNDSVIGQIFENFPIIKEIVDEVSAAFSFLGGIAGDVMTGIVAAVRGMVTFVMNALGSVASAISSVGSAFGKVAGFLGMDSSSIIGSVMQGNQAINSANASPLNNTTSNAISNSVATSKRETNVQVGEVIVNTQATDADGISRDIGGGLNSQLARLDSEFSSGVDR